MYKLIDRIGVCVEKLSISKKVLAKFFVTIQNPHQNQRKSIGFVLLAN